MLTRAPFTLPHRGGRARIPDVVPSPHRASSDPSPARPADELSRALDDVVARFGALLRGAAARHGLSAADVDEATQGMRIRLWRALGDGESIRRAPSSYLYRAAMSAVLDLVRSRRRRRESSLEETAPGGESPARETAGASLARAELHDALEGALGEIVESRRAVVRMYLAGYPREEIAELLGWTEGKTRNLLYRGLGELRAALVRRGIDMRDGGDT